jgi:threonylcarbamoyladenosine tRNA methylthiotransferase MtaB
VQVYLDFLGCRLNEAELSTWRRELQASGNQLVSSPSDAQVIALNTCAVTSEAAKKSRKHLRRLHRRNPKALLVATGCYATLSPEEAQKALGVDHVVPNSKKDDLVSIIHALSEEQSMPNMAIEPEAQPIAGQTRTRAFVKIQDGCRNKCSFCIVTVARGEERSRTEQSIIEEILHLCDLGYQEVVLTGVHIGGYGCDIQSNLKTLIKNILVKTSIPRLRIGSLEPWDIPDGFFELFQSPRLCPHLHLPLQSGSDAVLKRMIRRCKVKSYENLVSTARSYNPTIHISTDLIVGFPGESEAEFNESLDTIQRIQFGSMHLFRYSSRAGTAAERLGNKVPANIIKSRHQQAKVIAQKMEQDFLNTMVGQNSSVLWERDANPLPDGTIKWKGYTKNYLRIESVTPNTERLFNECTQTKVIGVNDGVLIGRLISEPAKTTSDLH